MKHGFLALALLVAGARGGLADEIVLVNGHTIKGARRVESKDPNKVVFEVGAGRIELDAKLVSSVNPGHTPLHDYDGKYASIQRSQKASDFWELALWCKENKLPRYVGPLCEQALHLDGSLEAAHRELGHEKLDGKWMTREEAMEKKGFKLVGDRWMTRSEIELQEKHRLEAREREMAQKAERERRREEERERRMAEMEAMNDWYAAQVGGLDGYFYQPNWFWPPYFRPYPWAVYRRNHSPYGGGYPYGYSDAIPTIPLFPFFSSGSLSTTSPFLKR
jgi:hypothetical protein